MDNIQVADIMTRDPVIIKTDTNLLNCAKKMVRKRVGSLLIVNDKKLVGFVSQRDILWALVKKSKDDLSKIKAIDISAKKIATIKHSATIKETIQKMKKLKFERLPVVHNNKLVGMITARDIFTFQPQLYPELEEFSKIREQSKKLKRVKKAEEVIEGVCEECGNHDILHREHGMLVCENCM